jgi:hypothetical protein
LDAISLGEQWIYDSYDVSMYVCVDVCMCVCMCMYVYVCMHLCIQSTPHRDVETSFSAPHPGIPNGQQLGHGLASFATKMESTQVGNAWGVRAL